MLAAFPGFHHLLIALASCDTRANKRKRQASHMDAPPTSDLNLCSTAWQTVNDEQLLKTLMGFDFAIRVLASKSLEDMPWNAARWPFTDGADSVSSAGWTFGKDSICPPTKIGLEIGPGRSVCDTPPILERPLLFG